MDLKKGLTKEDFWDEVEEIYPNSFKQFADWIDEYKKAVDWNILFRQPFGIKQQTKFHDLPYAMQLGIWITFLEHNNFEFTIAKTRQLNLSIHYWMMAEEYKS